VITDRLSTALSDLPAPDADCRRAVEARAAEILRPAGALARLDALAARVAGWQGTTTPRIERPVALVFAADHGVASDGVSAYPASVTAEMLRAFRTGVSSINAMARVAGAQVFAVDVGVGRPTGNLRVEPALTPERCDEAAHAGVTAVRALDTDLLVIGEMGIGNTTAAAAVAACLYGGGAETWVGRGTGVDPAGLARKRAVVAEAVRRVGPSAAPLEILRQVGGAEQVAMAAAVLEARRRHIVTVLDGYVTAAAVAPLHATRSDALDHCIAGHVSSEPGHRLVLERIGLAPLLDLDMRLGEGSGAMAAVPLIAMACELVTAVPTFGEWFGS
jgi:nicotinate-nucleotide--dimethylbenzimidazole phosphoribosyltransferase